MLLWIIIQLSCSELFGASEWEGGGYFSCTLWPIWRVLLQRKLFVLFGLELQSAGQCPQSTCRINCLRCFSDSTIWGCGHTSFGCVRPSAWPLFCLFRPAKGGAAVAEWTVRVVHSSLMERALPIAWEQTVICLLLKKPFLNSSVLEKDWAVSNLDEMDYLDWIPFNSVSGPAWGQIAVQEE